VELLESAPASLYALRNPVLRSPYSISMERPARSMANRLSQGARAIALKTDVADEKQVKTAVEQAVNELGSLDVLVNNAGIEVTGSVSDLTPADWDRQIAVNLRGVFSIFQSRNEPEESVVGPLVLGSPFHE
jgi:NAD(P)-dependent dehydrogenase (short-subunit alcohol dehydrogenase family)